MSLSPGHKIQAQNVHKSASQGPAPAFHWPLQAQLLSAGDLYRLRFCFWLCWRPNSCLRTTSFGSAPAQFLVAFEGPKVPQVKLSRPTLYLPVAWTGPAPT